MSGRDNYWFEDVVCGGKLCPQVPGFICSMSVIHSAPIAVIILEFVRLAHLFYIAITHCTVSAATLFKCTFHYNVLVLDNVYTVT